MRIEPPMSLPVPRVAAPAASAAAVPPELPPGVQRLDSYIMAGPERCLQLRAMGRLRVPGNGGLDIPHHRRSAT